MTFSGVDQPGALLHGACGAPLAGLQVLFFYLRNNLYIPHMRGGVTNAQGVATCGGVREQMYVLQKNGYIAQFGGAGGRPDLLPVEQ